MRLGEIFGATAVGQHQNLQQNLAMLLGLKANASVQQIAIAAMKEMQVDSEYKPLPKALEVARLVQTDSEAARSNNKYGDVEGYGVRAHALHFLSYAEAMKGQWPEAQQFALGIQLTTPPSTVHTQIAAKILGVKTLITPAILERAADSMEPQQRSKFRDYLGAWGFRFGGSNG